jgi:hypothetical protein
MAAQDLVTLAEAKAFLGKTGTADDPMVMALITRASDWIEQMTDRKLAQRTYTNLRFTGPRSAKLYVPAWPIAAGSAVTVALDGTAQTVWRTEADGDPALKDVVVASDDPWDTRWGAQNHFYRAAGWDSALSWGWEGARDPNVGQHNVLLTYTGGYATIPEDLKLAACYLIQKLFRDQQKQVTGMTAISVAAGGTITVPEPFMPREVRDLVAPYVRQTFVGA